MNETVDPIVVLETSEGAITVKLWAGKAPATVENFLKYVDEGFFDGTIFHRVIDGFMIQGGGFTPDMKQKKTRPPIRNEAAAGLGNRRGTIAMARTSVVDSATSQFFINAANNSALDHRNDTPDGFGYAAFGEVIAGMDVVDRINKVRTGPSGPHRDVPVKPVVIQTARGIERKH